MEPIKVIIVDDSDFVRDGMKIILDIDDDFEWILRKLARRNFIFRQLYHSAWAQ